MGKLQEHEYVFCLALHEKLKEKIRGKVYTTVKDDVLIVEIHMGRTDFIKTFDNFTDKLHFGLATDDIVIAIVSAYKKFLINNLEQRYFR